MSYDPESNYANPNPDVELVDELAKPFVRYMIAAPAEIDPDPIPESPPFKPAPPPTGPREIDLDALAEGAGEQTAKASLREILMARAFNFAVTPLPPFPVIRLGNKILLSPGNLLNLQAQVKGGKSSAIAAMIASVLNGNRQGPDTLGFSAENPEGKVLIHIDTEQSRYDHDALVRRSIRRARLTEPPPWLLSYCLTDLDIKERLDGLELLLEEAAEEHGGVFLVIIDGVADLCLDPNDAAEAFALVRRLHTTAIKYGCGIITVLHENPGSLEGKTRGHLGSQLERKCETNLRLAKDSNGVTTMWSERARHGNTPREEGLCFQWSDSAGMHVSCGTAREIKATAKSAKFRDEAESIFGEAIEYSFTDYVAKIRESVGVAKSTAEQRVKKYAAEGIVQKSADGIYRLKP